MLTKALSMLNTYTMLPLDLIDEDQLDLLEDALQEAFDAVEQCLEGPKSDPPDSEPPGPGDGEPVPLRPTGTG